MKSIELDMIVSDSLAALKTYQTVFDLKVDQATAYDRGLNEVIFSLYDLTIHLLDENPEYGLAAPEKNQMLPFWINVTVPDIQLTFSEAITAGFTEIQPVTKIPDFGVSNAVLLDPFGYQWMLHEVHEEKSTEELKNLMDQEFNT
ncbi:MAG: VOC family protein [Alkalibacterium sp.]|nr:VOC family protein [Alkalibacterium sp.]